MFACFFHLQKKERERERERDRAGFNLTLSTFRSCLLPPPPPNHGRPEPEPAPCNVLELPGRKAKERPRADQGGDRAEKAVLRFLPRAPSGLHGVPRERRLPAVEEGAEQEVLDLPVEPAGG